PRCSLVTTRPAESCARWTAWVPSTRWRSASTRRCRAMPGGIEIKTRDEIAYMRKASLIVYEVLEELTKAVTPGVTLEELDAIAERETVRRGAVCAFKGLYGFPKNVCISVNEQVV